MRDEVSEAGVGAGLASIRRGWGGIAAYGPRLLRNCATSGSAEVQPQAVQPNSAPDEPVAKHQVGAALLEGRPSSFELDAARSHEEHEDARRDLGYGPGASGPTRSFRGRGCVDECGRGLECRDGLVRPAFPADVGLGINSFVRLRALRGFVRYLIQMSRTPSPSRRAAPDRYERVSSATWSPGRDARPALRWRDRVGVRRRVRGTRGRRPRR